MAAARETGVDVGHRPSRLTSTPSRPTMSRLSRRPRDGGAHPRHLAVERDDDGHAREQALRRPRRHISTYASIATLWEVGLNHMFRGKDSEGHGDHVYWQGHASPGLYARAWMEAVLTTTASSISAVKPSPPTLLLSSPAPDAGLLEYPTVSMGLGAMTAIRQARVQPLSCATVVWWTPIKAACGTSWATANPMSPSRSRIDPRQPRTPRQPDDGRELQPPAA